MQLHRRHFLLAAGAAATSALVGAPRFAFAATPGDNRFVLCILRGAWDGLHVAPPYGDPAYADVRAQLAFQRPGAGEESCLDLDGTFGLHPALAPLHARYRQGQMLVVHAIATPYRERSHFDAQDLLENGTTRPRGAADGWLNRALPPLEQGRSKTAARLGLAVGQQVPLVLRGPSAVASWAPTALPPVQADFMDRVNAMWSRDPLLGPVLAEGMRTQMMSDEVLGNRGNAPNVRPAQSMAPLAEAAGKLLAAPDGPRIATLEFGGWDTHAGQGRTGGRLATALEGLAKSLEALASGLGPAWEKTAVLVVSEFGRTVAPNGTGGTDHGTGTAALLLGGAVRGGRVLADWPGLGRNELHEGRDLRATADLRALMKGVLTAHLGIAPRALDTTIFPDSAAVKPMTGLLRV